MEEDAGKSLHEGFHDSAQHTYIDYNRSGVPLIEIVTEPDLRSAADAATFFETLRRLLVWLGVNDGNMEEGSLRCDANVSVRPAGTEPLGTKTEVKNLNSFRHLQKALEHEIARQTELLAEGGRVVQETRLWDPAAARTVAMRSKEEAHDYRYFPEPDLPPLVFSAARVAAIAEALPELPHVRRARFVAEYGLADSRCGRDDALPRGRRLLRGDRAARGQPESGQGLGHGGAQSHVERARRRDRAGRGHAGGARRARDDSWTVAPSTARPRRRCSRRCTARGGRPTRSSEARGSRRSATRMRSPQSSATSWPLSLKRSRSTAAGKAASFGFLVGQVMKATSGKASPKVVNELLRREIEHG